VHSLAQKPLVRSFHNFNNFDASHIYDIEQDDKGFIWIASESGLFKFDGNIFRNIAKENGISNLKFSNLYFSENGTLWTTQIDARTWRIDHDILILQKSNKPWPVASMIPMKSSYRTNKDTLTFVSYGQDLYRFANDTLIEHKKISVDHVFFNFIRKINSKWQKKLGLYLQVNGHNIINSDKFKLGYASGYSNDSSFLLNVGNLQLFNKNNEIHYQFSDKTIQATLAIDEYYLISKQEVGILLYKNNSIQDTLVKGTMVTDLFADKNNGIWIGTLSDGLLYMPSLDVVKYSPRKTNNLGQITDIIEVGNQLTILEKHSEIRQLDKSNKRFNAKLKLLNNSKRIIKTSNSSLIALGDYSVMIIDIINNKFIIRKSISFNTPIYHAAILKKQLFVASIQGIISYSLDCNKINDTILSDQRITSLNVWDNKLFAGNNNGLWEVNSNDKIFKRSKNSIAHMNSCETNLFVAYKNNNIEIFSLTSNKVINLPNPIDINHISKSDSNIFISTKEGLKVIDNSFNLTSSFDFINRVINNTKIIKTYLLGNTLFVLNNNGLYSFPLHAVNKYTPYTIQLQTNNPIKTKDSAITLTIDKDLKHLHFILSTFNYENNIPPPLYYKINNEKYISPIKNNELNIAQINSGISLIEISDNKNFIKNQRYLNIKLAKTGYWYQNMYYQIILFSLISILIIFITINRVKNIKRKNILENTRISKMQTVLQQQMNPHFIFNSLTSINHYVIQNKPLESSKYLTKFSTLIRKILDNSAVQKVTLAEELEALEIYIDLELLRFKDKFSYSIKIAPNINTNKIKIVPFLIQPFIDRAIREHILNRSIKGTILIQFQTSDKYLVCNIIDNGLVIDNKDTSNNNYLNKTVKSGTQIVEQRIDVYNKQNRNKIFISNEIIKNHKNEVSGNKITIKHPIN